MLGARGISLLFWLMSHLSVAGVVTHSPGLAGRSSGTLAHWRNQPVIRGESVMFKSLVLAAVAAVGIGSAAQAAPLWFDLPEEDYESVFLHYDAVVTDSGRKCVMSECAPHEPEPVKFDLAVGQKSKATVELWREGDGSFYVQLWAFGQHLYQGFAWQSAGTISGSYDVEWLHSVSLGALKGLFRYDSDDAPYYESLTVNLTAPAPIPLPASAALFPLGFGALAAVRRRRRQV